MSSWEQMIAAKARHGNFVGSKQSGEDAYYDFFSGSDHWTLKSMDWLHTTFTRAPEAGNHLNMTFLKPVFSVFQRQY